MDKSWIIEQNDFKERKTTAMMESLFTMGNGFLGMRGNFPLVSRSVEKGTFINGCYESGPITYGEKAFGFAENWQTIVPLPEGKSVLFEADGELLSVDEESEGSLSRILNLKESFTRWAFILKDNFGRQYKGQVDVVIPFDCRGSVRFRWEISIPEGVHSFGVISSIRAERKSRHDSDDPRLPGHFDGSTLSYSTFPLKGRTLLSLKAEGSGLMALSAMNNRLSGISETEVKTESSPLEIREIFKGVPGRKVILEKTVSYDSGISEDSASLGETLIDELLSVSSISTENLLHAQKVFMDQFWEKSDILLSGDEEAQLSLRYNLFQLLQSTGRDSRRSIAAKGLSGSGYEGHYFWDAETYVLPFFIHTNPSIAKSMLKYRISIVPMAQERARLLNHKGLLFPWRTIGGEECSAYYPAGTAQYHINSDIALGLAAYLDVTGDLTLIEEGGDQLLAETARFWCDLGTYVEGKGICFHGVTGPDEYTAIVDNNYYTNLSARENLMAAARFLKGRIDEKERSHWLKTAREIYLPDEGGITPQDDSFLEKEKWDFESTPSSSYPLLLHYHPLNIYRKQVLKQADVIMAQALFPSELTSVQMKKNFDYYEPLTTRDSSLSACAQGICAYHLGYGDLAWEYFLETLHTDRKDLHGNVSQGLHTAAMGGSYLILLKGFLGFQSVGDTHSFKPELPDQLQRIQANIQIGSSLIGITLRRDTVTYTAKGGDPEFLHFGSEVSLRDGEERTLPLYPREKKMFTLFRPKV